MALLVAPPPSAPTWQSTYQRLWEGLGPYLEPYKKPEISRIPRIPGDVELSGIKKVIETSGIEIVDEDRRDAQRHARGLSRLISSEALSWLDRMTDAEATGYWSPELPRHIRHKLTLSGYEVSVLVDRVTDEERLKFLSMNTPESRKSGDGEKILGFYANRVVEGSSTPGRQSETLQALGIAVDPLRSLLELSRVSIDNEVVINSSVNEIRPGMRRLLYYAMHGYCMAELRAKGVQLAVTVCRRKNPNAMKAHYLCGWRKVRWESEPGDPEVPDPPYRGTKEIHQSKAGTEWDLLVIDPFSKQQKFFMQLAPRILPIKILDQSHLDVLSRAVFSPSSSSFRIRGEG